LVVQEHLNLTRMVVLGATGDLALRHLLPALVRLVAAGSAPSDLTVAAVSREPMTTSEYRRVLAARLEHHAGTVPLAAREDLLARIEYHAADLERSTSLAAAVGADPVIAYLALPPATYPLAVRALREAGIHPASRIAVEKPFGTDAGSARALTELLHATVPERNVFRVDHFLHHQTVQNLLALRWHNPFVERLWSREHVERVEIVWEETAGVGDRAGFYDGTGALRDMVQSHLLQLVALVAMDLPAELDERHLRDAKADVLRTVRPPCVGDVSRQTVRGRFTAGVVDGAPVRGYAELPGVDPDRDVETYAALRLEVDDERWRGVPFLLRTGKALGQNRRTVTLHLRAPATRGGAAAPAGALQISMLPERIGLRLALCGPDGAWAPAPVELAAEPPPPSLPASGRLLLDLLSGDPARAVRDDEAQECWRVVDAVLAGWREAATPVREYAAGSAGPVPVDWPGPADGGL
jgi:glucose-6-phosphate 1-dehydrogenase